MAVRLEFREPLAKEDGVHDRYWIYRDQHRVTPVHTEASELLSQNAYRKGQALTFAEERIVIEDQLRPAGDASTYLVTRVARGQSVSPPAHSTSLVLKIFDPKTTLYRALSAPSYESEEVEIRATVIPWSSKIEAWAQRWLTGPQARQFRFWLQENMSDWRWLEASEGELLDSDDPEDRQDYHDRFSKLMQELHSKPWGEDALDGSKCIEAYLQDRCELAFRRELFAYRRLESYQGTRIPKVLQHGQVDYHDDPERSYRPWALLLEYVEDAVPLSDQRALPPISPQLKVSLEQAIRDVVDWCTVFGVLQNDLEADNVLIVNGGTRVVILDFSEALVAGIPPRSYDANGTLLPLEGDLFPQELDDTYCRKYDDGTPDHVLGVQDPRVYRKCSFLLHYERVYEESDLLKNWQSWLDRLKRRPHRERVCHQFAERDKAWDSRVFYSEQLEDPLSTKKRTVLRQKKRKAKLQQRRIRKKFFPASDRWKPLSKLVSQMETTEEDETLRDWHSREFQAACKSFQRGEQPFVAPMLEATKALPPSVPFAAYKVVHSLAARAMRDADQMSPVAKAAVTQRIMKDEEVQTRVSTADEFLRIEDRPLQMEWERAGWEMHDVAGIWAILKRVWGINRRTQCQWLAGMPTHTPATATHMAKWVWEHLDPNCKTRITQWRSYNALVYMEMRRGYALRFASCEEALLDRIARYEYERSGGARSVTFR